MSDMEYVIANKLRMGCKISCLLALSILLNISAISSAQLLLSSSDFVLT
ncbi:hypothetical protein SDC9_129759 [bioreactor metagenome]|uniref:Uncharacterized protein n=1 Tax=bioreactor metagenome TaxID=1076179 RepID=A0A645D0J6_9ZZZZ